MTNEVIIASIITAFSAGAALSAAALQYWHLRRQGVRLRVRARGSGYHDWQDSEDGHALKTPEVVAVYRVKVELDNYGGTPVTIKKVQYSNSAGFFKSIATPRELHPIHGSMLPARLKEHASITMFFPCTDEEYSQILARKGRIDVYHSHAGRPQRSRIHPGTTFEQMSENFDP